MPWIAEVKQIFIRRAENYGEPYTGVAVLTFSGDSVNIELLKADEFTREDKQEIARIITDYWPETKYNYTRFKKINKGN